MEKPRRWVRTARPPHFIWSFRVGLKTLKSEACVADAWGRGGSLDSGPVGRGSRGVRSEHDGDAEKPDGYAMDPIVIRRKRLPATGGTRTGRGLI